MMEKRLPYLERELSMWRRTCAEFASRHPKLPGSLLTQGEICADLHLERLIQASAFPPNSRIAQPLSDGCVRFTEVLLGMLYPYYSQPIPWCPIARIDHSGSKFGGWTSIPAWWMTRSAGTAKN